MSSCVSEFLGANGGGEREGGGGGMGRGQTNINRDGVEIGLCNLSHGFQID